MASDGTIPEAKIEAADFMEYQLAHALRIQIEGDLSLLDEVIAQLRQYVARVTNNSNLGAEPRHLLLPNVKVALPEKKHLEIEWLKIEFVDEVKKSKEGILNAINFASMPLLRVYLYNSQQTQTKVDTIKGVKDFISSNYDKAMVETAARGQPKLGKQENDRAVKTRWVVLCVGKVPPGKNRIDFVRGGGHG